MKEDKENPDETLDIESLAGSISEPKSAEEGQPDTGGVAGEVPESSGVPAVEEPAADAGGGEVPESPDIPAVEERAADAGGGDIEDLIKKYEELPPKKDAPAKPSKPKGQAGKKIPLVPVVIVAVVLVAVVALKFLTKPSKVKTLPVKTAQVKKKTSSVPALSGAGSLLYPGAIARMDEKKDGIEMKIYETNASLSDIKLFYQKKMADMGYEISSGRKNVKTFNMGFTSGKKLYNISVIPRAGKNVIVLSRPVGI